MHDTRTLVDIAVVTVFVNIPLSWWLSEHFGFSGLASGRSLTYIVCMQRDVSQRPAYAVSLLCRLMARGAGHAH